jgi:signal peptidase I
VVAWSVVPNVLGLAIWLIALTELKLTGAFGATTPTLITALRWLTALLGLWSLIVMMLMLARIQGFGFWRTIANAALGSLLLPILLALIVRTFLFQPFDIPSRGMMPTLLSGDYLFVSKYSYGYSHYSLPLSPRWFSGRIFASEPQRGDVVVFRLPKNDSADFIQRLVGLPGDRIQMRVGVLYINGQPVKRERVEDFSDRDAFGRSQQVNRWRETLANGVSYETLALQDDGFYDNTPEYKVPAGQYFMIGDNRDNSNDSRNPSEIGTIPFENLVGRAERIFLSIDQTSPTGQAVLRFERLGAAVR